jgi:hypothetical protein
LGKFGKYDRADPDSVQSRLRSFAVRQLADGLYRIVLFRIDRDFRAMFDVLSTHSDNSEVPHYM